MFKKCSCYYYIISNTIGLKKVEIRRRKIYISLMVL